MNSGCWVQKQTETVFRRRLGLAYKTHVT